MKPPPLYNLYSNLFNISASQFNVEYSFTQHENLNKKINNFF